MSAAAGSPAERPAERTAARGVLIVLAVCSAIELLSIAILLVNLGTLHLRPITSTMGPVHGAAYLAVVVTAMFARGLTPLTRALAWVPVLGGILMFWRVRVEHRRAAASAR